MVPIQSFLVACLILTAAVVGVTVRIEVLNAQSGYFLPRVRYPYSRNITKWELPELEDVVDRIDHQFYERRCAVAVVTAAKTHQDITKVSTGLTDAETAEVTSQIPFGPPYSDVEQRFIDSVKRLHDSHTRLHWWMSFFGRPMYFVGGVTVLFSVLCLVALNGWFHKSTAGLCTCLSIACILVILTRNYWEALGV